MSGKKIFRVGIKRDREKILRDLSKILAFEKGIKRDNLIGTGRERDKSPKIDPGIGIHFSSRDRSLSISGDCKFNLQKMGYLV